MSETSRDVAIQPGARLLYQGKPFDIQSVHSATHCAGVLVETGERRLVEITSLRVPLPADPTVGRPRAYSDEEWEEGQRRFAIIKPLLDAERTTTAAVVALATKHDLSPGTIFRWLRIFREEGETDALIPQARGRKVGVKLVDKKLEEIIEVAIETKYLQSNPPGTPKAVMEEILLLCRAQQLTPPSSATIYRRLRRIDPRSRLRKRGYTEKAEHLYTASPGHLDIRYPLEQVQVDHTLSDIFVLTEKGRKYASRPWITVAIDSFSRMIVGFYISMDHPSAVSVGMCLANAICTKDEYLQRLGVQGSWCSYGFMNAIHTDNGKDFRAKSLNYSLAKYNIDKEFRPLGKKNYGGRIERLMGTIAGELKKIPGATMSNVAERGPYNSAEQAVLTLKELEQYLVRWIVNNYNRTVHSSLHMAPVDKWQLGILGDGVTKGRGIIPMPGNQKKITLEFMPFVMHTIQSDGVSCDGRNYFDPILNHYILDEDPVTGRKRKFMFRWDPVDATILHFLEPNENTFYEISTSTPYGPTSRWEFKEQRKRARAIAKEKEKEHEDARCKAIQENRQLVADATAKTRQERKNVHRHEQREIALAAGAEDSEQRGTQGRHRGPQAPLPSQRAKFNFAMIPTVRPGKVIP